MKKEKFKTMHNVFDEFTNRNLYKMINEGHFKGMIGQINMGKESNVFVAEREDGAIVIVKIYRLESCDFKRMYDYIKYDPRYNRLKKRKREVIFSWTQREFRNILKAREAQVRVPVPITFKHNILVESFIGDDSPAPKLKDAYPKDPQAFFDDIVSNMVKLAKHGLVHADLSAFNILNYKEKPCFIDFSQTTPKDNPNSLDYLKRDVVNVCNFFIKNGLLVDKEKTYRQVAEVFLASGR